MCCMCRMRMRERTSDGASERVRAFVYIVYYIGEREAKRKPARKLQPPLPAMVVRRDAGRGIDCGVGGGGDVTHGGLVPLACGTPHWLSAKHTAPSDRRRHRYRHRQTEQGAADCGRPLTYIPSKRPSDAASAAVAAAYHPTTKRPPLRSQPARLSPSPKSLADLDASSTAPILQHCTYLHAPSLYNIILYIILLCNKTRLDDDFSTNNKQRGYLKNVVLNTLTRARLRRGSNQPF